MDTGFRSLAEQLRSWPTERLSRLLLARPDLATPSPHDSGQLAARAATRTSLQRALDQLTLLELTVLDALVLANQTTNDRLCSIVYAEHAAIRAAVSHLEDTALAWRSTGGLRALTGVVEVLRAGPGASGLQPFAGLSDDDVVRRLEALSSPARAMLEAVDAGGGQATTAKARLSVSLDEAGTPAEELAAHGLLVPAGEGRLRLPGEVGLALRGGRTTTAPVDVPPQVPCSTRSAALVDRAAAGAAFEVVRRVELLLDGWGATPPRSLRGSGGLAVRDLRATAQRLHVTEAEAALVLETCLSAGLLGVGTSEEGDPSWLPTERYDEWLAQRLPARWLLLARAWLGSPRLPGLVGRRDPAGKTWNALSPDLVGPTAPRTRALVLSVLASLPDGEVPAAGTGPAALVARMEWLRPRQGRTRTESPEALVEWTLTEAAGLGLTGLGGLSSYARMLVAGDDPSDRLTDLLPEPVDHVLLQGDLTAVAPGPLEPALARTMAVVADVESGGGATVYRFTKDSVRRAMDRGWSAADLHELLAGASRTPVPQALTYLVDDTARTFGSVRVGFAAAYLRSDDEDTLAELLAHPAAESLGLRRLAPTVVLSTVAIDALLPRLRDLGLAPVVEAPDGTVHVPRPDALRARTPTARAPGASAAHDAARASAVAAAVRAGDATAASRTAAPSTPVAAIQEAIDERVPVDLVFVDARGEVASLRVLPLSLDGGHLTAQVGEDDEDVRSFAVARLRSVQPASV